MQAASREKATGEHPIGMHAKKHQTEQKTLQLIQLANSMEVQYTVGMVALNVCMYVST